MGSMSMNCPFCQKVVEEIDQHDVKNGSWALEPLPDFDANYACYRWDEDRLTVYFHK